MEKIIDEKQDRLRRLELLKENGILPYKDKFIKKDKIKDIPEMPIGTKVITAGRLMLIREMGKLTFAHIQDYSGKMQIVLKDGTITTDKYKLLLKVIDIGDFIGVEGEVFKTQKGEISILVEKYEFLN